jgi:hydrogenase maturation protease
MSGLAELTIMSDSETRVLVIGIGNAYRRDDAVGLVLARRLKEEFRERVEVLEHSGEGTALMEAWKNAKAVILLDAVHSGGAPGIVYRLDAQTTPIPAQFFHYSTHAFSVAEAVELARTLAQLPPRLIIYGIEGASFKAGTSLSPAVESAMPEIVERIRQEIASLESHTRSCTNSHSSLT